MSLRLFLAAGTTAAMLLSTLTAMSRQREPRQPAVELQTEAGVVTIVLHRQKAPASARAFLAQIRGKRYDGGSFFRAVRPDNDKAPYPIEVVQAGIREDGKPVAEARIPHEDTSRTGLRHIDGAVSLPRSAMGTGTATSFFVSIGAHPALDFGGKRNPDGQGFAVFGQVSCGMDVVRRIQALPVSADSPPSPMQGQILARPVKIVRARMVQSRCSKR